MVTWYQLGQSHVSVFVLCLQILLIKYPILFSILIRQTLRVMETDRFNFVVPVIFLTFLKYNRFDHIYYIITRNNYICITLVSLLCFRYPFITGIDVSKKGQRKNTFGKFRSIARQFSYQWHTTSFPLWPPDIIFVRYSGENILYLKIYFIWYMTCMMYSPGSKTSSYMFNR
jgi:hypothetical protein